MTLDEAFAKVEYYRTLPHGDLVPSERAAETLAVEVRRLEAYIKHLEQEALDRDCDVQTVSRP